MTTSTISFSARPRPIASSAKQHSKRYDIFVNLCEGYLDWDIPSIDVIQALDSLEAAVHRALACAFTIPPKSS